MKSKQRSKLNGRPDTRHKKKAIVVKEVYGAQIDRPAVTSFEEKRKPTKKYRKEEPKPDRLYNLGDIVSVSIMGVKWTNWRIWGYEWGGNHRDFRRDVWLYRMSPSYAEEGAEGILVAEDVIQGIIS